MKTRYEDIVPYVTKDGSTIRELMHPALHGNQSQSLAEAVLAPGRGTASHIHRESEEIYHITRGTGRMTLGEATFDVAPGDTVSIPAGTPHSIVNTGPFDMAMLCCCTPAYTHDDTLFTEEVG